MALRRKLGRWPPDEILVAESVAEGKLASASYRNSHVLSGFTWRPPSAEERQLARGRSHQGPASILYRVNPYNLLKNNSLYTLHLQTC